MKDSEGFKTLIDNHLQGLALRQRLPKRLYEPMDYILTLKAKRMRPVLTMLAYHSVTGQDVQRILNLATAVELFHNFTLMHDDIMDRAPVRRGKPSVHKVWNENVAILSGDALFAYSVGFVGRDFPEVADRLCEEYSRIALVVCEGQMQDMDLAEQPKVSITDYLDMICKKTATLIGGCMSLGAMAGGAADEVVNLYRKFGEQVGMAFQLQDDLMDAFPPEGFGKQVGGDILEKKKTYLYIKALELANKQQATVLTHIYQQEDLGQEEIQQVLEVFGQLQIEQHTQNLIQQYFDAARNTSAQVANRSQFEPIRNYVQKIAKRKI